MQFIENSLSFNDDVKKINNICKTLNVYHLNKSLKLMKFRPSNFIQLTLATIVSILSFSCNKDSDLLAEYVVEQPQAFLVNDVVVTLANNPIVIEPLSNDTFKEPEKVTITEVTPPKMGTAEVQEDNTVVYTPNPDETGADEFNYTTTVTNPDNSVSTETGSITVTVTPTDKTPTDPNAVNFSKYGAVGDGKTDDTKAIQAALDTEKSLVGSSGAVYKITERIDIDKVGNQTIDWNGSTIITSATLNPAIDIDKKSVNGGTTTMSNLLFEGNNLVVRAIYMESRVVFNNVTVQNLNQGSQGTVSPAGFYARVKNDADSFGSWEFNNCKITNLVGTSKGPNSNCVVASNTDGSVNGVLWYWDVAPSTKTTVTWNNLTVDGMWGDDGGGIFINDNVGMKNTTSGHVFNNSTIKNCERRALKGFSSNMTFNNVTFEDAMPTDSNIQCGTISGLVVFGSSQRANIHFDSCTFIGHDYDGRVIPIAVENWSIKNSTFIGGAYVAMTNLQGRFGNGVNNGLIESNDFGTQGYISKYGTNSTWTDGTIGIGTNNTWGGGSPDIRLSGSEYYSY